jgi:hypothetical protein
MVLGKQTICHKIKDRNKPGLVADDYNPSSPGGRAQEDQGLRPAQADNYQDTISINKPSIMLVPVIPEVPAIEVKAQV